MKAPLNKHLINQATLLLLANLVFTFAISCNKSKDKVLAKERQLPLYIPCRNEIIKAVQLVNDNDRSKLPENRYILNGYIYDGKTLLQITICPLNRENTNYRQGYYILGFDVHSCKYDSSFFENSGYCYRR